MPDDFYAVATDKVAEELTGSPAPVLIDTRTQAESDKDGYIAGATLIPFNDFYGNLDKLPADKTARVVIYCGSGHRGGIIMMSLRLMGYENVVNLGGGLGAWKTAQLPVTGWINWPVVWGEYLTAMPEGYYTIKAADLNTALVEKAPFLLDVRETTEVEKDGFIAGAVNIPVRAVLANLDKLPAKDQPIVIYCASGHRGGMVMAALQLLGYTDVKNLAGGTGAWKKAELALVTGEKPAAPVAGTSPEVDATRLRDLNKFLSELPEGFYTVKPADLNVELTASPAPFILDVRTPDEFAAGYIQGATNIKIQDVPANLASVPAKDQPIVVLCQSGHRGAIVMMYLRMTGYANVRNLGGGMNAWAAAELPVVK
jgi:rhodanese-related sulfurtransferase